MIDLFSEIVNTIRQNKLRTFLTGFAVAWGIFMLIVLFGAGNGLKNGFNSNWGDRMLNVVQIWGGRTNMPYAGFQSGRWITLDNKDLDFTDKEFKGDINYVIGNIRLGNKNVLYGQEYVASSVQGASPKLFNIDGLKMEAGNGRFINELDLKENRKVIVISKRSRDILFKKEDALGKKVILDGFVYTVVGVYYIEDREDATGSYIPLTTAQIIYKRGINISNMAFTLTENINTEKKSETLINRYKKRLQQQHQISPDDEGAIWMWNRFENHFEMMAASNAINLAVWIIGIFTLLSGVVGVSNIMLITVRERTKEFGIRKAIGASPLGIIRLVVVESIFITTIFGYIGLVLGVGLTELLGSVFQSGGGGRDSFNVFVNPTVDINTAIAATIVLIIAGTLAGFFPALKAVQIKTIEALNDK